MTVTDSRGCKSKADLEINQVRSCHTCYPFTPQCTPTHFLICNTCMTPVYLNIEDFGADGSDDQSDQCAFEEVSNYINSLHPDVVKELTIPPGTYYVGRQVSGLGGYYLSGVGVLCFQNINNLTINRVHKLEKAILKFSNCMKYGAFDVPSNPDNRFLSDNGRLITCTMIAGNTSVTYTGAAIDPSYTYDVWDPDPNHTTPLTKFIPNGTTISNITSSTFTLSNPPSNFTGTIVYQLGIISNCRSTLSQMAHYGDMIHLNFCKNITINNLELDGNIQNAIIGGGGSADGLQHPYDGIFINASNDITINNIDEHHFGHDGLWLRYVDCDLPPTASTADMNCHVINSKFQFNGRNALSWTGGRVLTCDHCEFSFSGQSRIVSQPGAGMDIEFEPILDPSYYSQENIHGIFRGCRFRYNKLHGFISDGGLGTRFTSNDYAFDQCEFVAGESVDCVWPNVAGCHFATCNFYGSLVNPFENSNALPFFTDFNDCVFDNCYFGENYKERDIYAPVDCIGIHSYTTTESETAYSSGLWIPGITCPTSHKPQIDFSHASRVSFINGLSEQGFSNQNILIGTELTNTPDIDWNTINGTIFSSSGMNVCRCYLNSDRTPVLIDFTKIGLSNAYVRLIGPLRASTPNVSPWLWPFAYLEPSTYASVTVNFVRYGDFWQAPYTDVSNPSFDLMELAPKFFNLVVSNSAMPLYSSPCILTSAFLPSTCIPPLRHRDQSNIDFYSTLKVTPTISNEKIIIESSQSNDQCQIVNSLGEIVLSYILINNSREININNLRAGFYIIKSKNGSVAKFIKY